MSGACCPIWDPDPRGSGPQLRGLQHTQTSPDILAPVSLRRPSTDRSDGLYTQCIGDDDELSRDRSNDDLVRFSFGGKTDGKSSEGGETVNDDERRD
jgi:hypothetical protein